jgi:hypothetical protein
MYSQTVTEAVRYSSFDYASTARSIGVGGAFSALGADMSASTINPAGLGEYRFGEFVFSFGVNLDNQNATLGNQSTSNSKVTSNIGVLGYVSTNRHRSTSALNYSSFAISLNRFLSFDNAFEYEASTQGSITERFIERANTLGLNDLDDFEAGPAFDAGAIFDFDGDLFYESDFGDFSAVVPKRQTVSREGSGSELNIGYGASLKSNLSFGINLGIPIFQFTELKEYSEFDSAGDIDFFESLSYLEMLETSGVGVNAKIGIIYRLNNKIKLSLAGHTPSAMFLSDEFFTDFTYTFNETGQPESVLIMSPNSLFDYQFTTPWRAILGGAYMFTLGGDLVQRRNEEDTAFAARRKSQTRGFLSAEIEFVGYTNSNFNLTVNSNDPLDQAFEQSLNEEITSTLKSIPIVKIGAEIAKGKFRYRAGARYQPSIFVNDNSETIRFSGGLGIRINRVFLDLSATFDTTSLNYSPYFLTNSAANQIVNVEGSRISADLTFGYKI